MVHGNLTYYSVESQFDIRNTGDPGNQAMKSKEVDVGIYRIKFTVYKTGNVHVCFVNRISGEERALKVGNPFALQKKVSSLNYTV